jgi:GT2 family glycosyltransferase
VLLCRVDELGASLTNRCLIGNYELMDISVLIATWMRRRQLELLIRDLQSQVVDASYEIIVCDSNSPDGSSDLVRALSVADKRIKLISNCPNTLSSKRNAGLRESEGEIAIFMDDDVRVPSHFIAAHLNAQLASDGFMIGCGQVRFPKEWIQASNYSFFRDSRYIGPARPDLDHNRLPYNNITVMNLSFRRKEVLAKAGFVSERFKNYGCEDIEFGYRLIEKGFELKYIPQALMYHYEAGASLELYSKKLYTTALYSMPILETLVPRASLLELKSYRLFTPVTSKDRVSVVERIIRVVVSICCAPLFERVIITFLNKTDKIRQLYSSKLHMFVVLCALRRGIRDQKCLDGHKKQAWI